MRGERYVYSLIVWQPFALDVAAHSAAQRGALRESEHYTCESPKRAHILYL